MPAARLPALAQPNLTAVNRYLPALLMVIRNEADPITAREECEET